MNRSRKPLCTTHTGVCNSPLPGRPHTTVPHPVISTTVTFPSRTLTHNLPCNTKGSTTSHPGRVGSWSTHQSTSESVQQRCPRPPVKHMCPLPAVQGGAWRGRGKKGSYVKHLVYIRISKKQQLYLHQLAQHTYLPVYTRCLPTYVQ